MGMVWHTVLACTACTSIAFVCLFAHGMNIHPYKVPWNFEAEKFAMVHIVLFLSTSHRSIVCLTNIAPETDAHCQHDETTSFDLLTHTSEHSCLARLV